MHDEEPGESRDIGGFGDELSHMLRRRAGHHPDHPDPVGMTRKHVQHAGARRRKASLSALAVTAVMATGGTVWGTQAFAGNGDGNAGRPLSPGGAITAPTSGPSGKATPPASRPSTPGGSDSEPGGVPSTPPTGDDVAHGCDPNAVLTMTAKNFAWQTRGSLASDAALGSTLLQRATTLTGGSSPKLAYAGETTTTRVAVVVIDPPNDDVCGPGLRMVVFHGPKGTAADQLSAQIGHGVYSPQSGLEWAQRGADGALTLLLVEPPTVRTLQASGTLGTDKGGAQTAVPVPDGSLLTTYSPATPVPAVFDFKDPATGQDGADHVTVTVAQPTAQALATALGIDPAKVTPIDASAHMGIAFAITKWTRFSLTATDVAAGAEKVYWTEFH